MKTCERRQLVSSGSMWENVVGYSRAIRVGNAVEISGTTAVDAQGTVIGKDSAYAQTKFIIEKIENALKEAGCSIKDVVRTRIYVTNIMDWREIGRAHGEVFGETKPACTMIQVAGLIDPELLVEIEASAIIIDATDG